MQSKYTHRRLTEAYKTIKEADVYDNIVVDYFRYDYNSNIRRELDDDEKQFGIKLFYDSRIETSVGSKVSAVGKPEAIQKFMKYYDLETASEEDLAEYQAELTKQLKKASDDGHQFGRGQYTSYS